MREETVMNSRERVIATLKHHEPDRIPVYFEPTIGFYRKLLDYLGIGAARNTPMGKWTEVPLSSELLTRLDLDIIRVGLRPANEENSLTAEDTHFTDEWGVGYEKIFHGEQDGFYFEMTRHPLAEATEKHLDDYNWPSVPDNDRILALKQRVMELYSNTRLAIMTSAFGSLFETAEYLRGQTQWLMDLVLDADFAESLLSRICELELESDRRIIEAVGQYIQIYHIGGEDLGTQKSTLISPDTYREIVKPFHKRRWKSAKDLLAKINPDCRLMLHSCGAISPLIRDFVDCGIDVLDPIQPLASGMESSKLKEEFGETLSFCGGIDIQNLLPFCSPQEVKEETRRKIRELGHGGGYIVKPAHFVPDNVPPENILAMVDAAKEFGIYPI
jgi:uroporphyrinogen decarboxylase